MKAIHQICSLLPLLGLCLLLTSSRVTGEDETDEDIISEFVNTQHEHNRANPAKSEENLSNERVSSNEDNLFVPQKPATTSGKLQAAGDKDKEVLHEDEPCSCVKYFLCDIDNGTIIENGDVIGLIDIRLGSSKVSPCSHYFDICCKTKKNPSGINSLASPPKISGPTNEHSVCGQRNTGGVGFRITGATDGEAQFGEFPWMAAIVRQEPQTGDKPPLNIFVCGGSLIHPRVVMTAAHCVFGKPPAELKVRLGEWDTQTLDELYQHQDRFVQKIVVHEEYYMGALYNDIALIFLDDEIKFAPNVDTICLPPPNVNFDGQRCVASGWGKDSFEKEGKYQVILKRLDLPIVPRDNCESSLRKTRLGPYFKLDRSFVCAGGEAGKDTCRGDGGSPLVCKLPNSEYYVQYGIVAWGIGCGENGVPGVYVNVPKFVPWIETQLQNANLDTKYYKNTA